jgi:hypothetical protein
MATAAAVAARRNAGKKRKDASNKSGVSFHLRLHLGEDASLPDGLTQVGWLRSPLRSKERNQESPLESNKSRKKNQNQGHNAGTRFEVWTKKFNNKSKIWQDTLLIVTERRLFIVSKKDSKTVEQSADGEESKDVLKPNDWIQPTDKDLEIIDSIPMDEIVSVELNTDYLNKPWSPVFVEKDRPIEKALQKWFQSVAESLSLNIEFKSKNQKMRQQAIDAITAAEEQLKQDAGEFRQQLTSDPQNSYCEGLIRVVTDPEGFNRGHPYYFLVRKDTFKSWKGTLDWKQAREGISRTLSHLQRRNKQDISRARKAEDLDNKVERKLKSLAAKRRLDVKRETRFLRLQAYLQSIWNSKRFNIALLFLIVSNFVFTVQQLENDDPSRQRYFEDIDLAYTIIFSIGDVRFRSMQ